MYASIKEPLKSYEEAYYGKRMQIDHQSLQDFHYHEKLLKAVQQIRTLWEETQQYIHCKVTPALMSSELEVEGTNEIPKTFAYYDP